MTDDSMLREALTDRLIAEPPLNLTPSDVLTAGRRARIRRQFAVVAAGGIGVAVVMAGGFALLPGGEVAPAPASPPAAAVPPAAVVQSGVPGLIEARMRAGLPGGEALIRRTIYPSDWNRNTPLPNAEAKNATDWHGQFGIPGHPTHDVWVGVFVNPPGSNPTEADLRRQCGSDPRCTVQRLGDGSLLLSQTAGTAQRWFRSAIHFRAGDRAVNVRERITGAGSEPPSSWVYSPAQLAAVAKDPRLVIPAPVKTPPLPTPTR
jgi:hypothetical protein